MTKLAAPTKKQPHNPPRQADYPPRRHLDGTEGNFFRLMVAAAGITRKELQYDLRYSKTYVDLIMSGEKHDPLSRSRAFCRMLALRKRTDLVATVLTYVAGGDDFDGRVLTPQQNEWFRNLAESMKEKKP